MWAVRWLYAVVYPRNSVASILSGFYEDNGVVLFFLLKLLFIRQIPADSMQAVRCPEKRQIF